MKIKKNIITGLVILIAVAMCGIVLAGQNKGLKTGPTSCKKCHIKG